MATFLQNFMNTALLTRVYYAYSWTWTDNSYNEASIPYLTLGFHSDGSPFYM